MYVFVANWYRFVFVHIASYTVLEIRIRNWLAIFLKIAYFIGVPLKMYRKFGRPKWILVRQMLKLIGKWPMTVNYF